MRVRVFAPAKINLTLHVGPLRADGRHNIESVAVFADIGDWVWAEDDDRPSLNLAGPFAAALASERNNLVVRAAQLMAQASGVTRGVRLTLDKHLPIASGLGGGSADAAATLRALDALWGLNLSMRDLTAIAAEIGADGPACMGSYPCWLTGAGEQAMALPHWPDLDVVLVNPGIASATAEVYRRFDEMGLAKPLKGGAAPDISSASRARDYVAAGRNDLAEPAIALGPAIGEVLSLLQTHAPIVRLSGSGATCFALVESAARARALAAKIAAERPDWWVRATRLVRSDVAARRL